jgi:Tol biopolymer transport system component
VVGVRGFVVLLASAALAVLLASAVALVLAVAEPAQAAFPGTNGKIVYEDGSYIWVMDADGSNRTLLTGGVADGFSEDPVWSPNGTKIAFTRTLSSDTVTQNREIYVMDADGSNQKRLTTDPYSDAHAAWSPDGRKIVFVGTIAVNKVPVDNDLFIMNADGSNRTNITNTLSMGEELPAWSPDGKKIAFQSTDSGDIYTMDVTGSNRTNLTNSPNVSDAYPDWSPDGSKIVFVSGRDGNREIYVMKAEPESATNIPTRLTNNAAADCSPVFSPDGSKIVFGSTRSPSPGLYSMNADGSNATSLLGGTGCFAGTDWQRLADTIKPTGSVLIDGGADVTSSRVVTLTLDATDPAPGSGVESMRIKNAGRSWTA